MKGLSISQKAIKYLKNNKNLLAFSGGTDSAALFFVLQDYNIDFDIAIIDYCLREQSKEEVEYAQKLGNKYNKQCHILVADIIKSNFEANARTIRYDFFHSLILQYNYKNLITAHHFDDRLEWFFMRLADGAGINTLLGFREITQRVLRNKQYHIIRPLINYTKKEILQYNHTNQIHYFIDESNKDSKYLRNFFRENIVGLMSDQFANGIKRSFEFLNIEYEILYKEVMVCVDYNLYCFKNIANDIHIIDMLTKQLGYIMSVGQKCELKEVLNKNGECIMGGKIVIAKNANLTFVGINIACILEYYIKQKNADKNNFQSFNNIFIPSSKDFLEYIQIIQTSNKTQYRLKIPKQQRDTYRIQNIPKKIRPLMYINSLKIWETHR